MLRFCEYKPHVKSTLTLEDDSKIGTTLDGEKFKQETRTLTKDEHTIQLGSWDQKFT